MPDVFNLALLMQRCQNHAAQHRCRAASEIRDYISNAQLWRAFGQAAVNVTHYLRRLSHVAFVLKLHAKTFPIRL